MNKTLKTLDEIDLEIGIHLTPITGMDPVNTDYNCNHSTQFASQFNALKTVTQLHLGGVCEN